jgi:hypothetical protein
VGRAGSSWAACESAVSPPDGGAVLSDAGVDAGTDAGRFIDVRFRGVGEAVSLVSFSGFGGGPYPGGGTDILWSDGSLFGQGVFNADYLFWRGYSYPGAGRYETRVYVAGSSCDSALADDLQYGDAVLGLGGDPTRSDLTCTVLGVHPIDGGVPYDAWVSGLSVGSQAVDLLNSTADYRRLVITALSEVDAGVYAFVAVARQHAPVPEQFEARFEVAGVEGIAAVAATLSDAGMIITAGTGGPSGYTLIGTRPVGSTRSLVSSTEVNAGVDIDPGTFAVLGQGLAPVAFMLRSLSDGGFETVVIGQGDSVAQTR